ncbi:hypothetical protein CEY00_Acc00204 [Actinidia chinensis var. chinensis]|uniref:DUF2470 domain-containing protein n=1 Tax=Actinidia chinensis var. chinensis TaxID=1590841 RepID=A0A2R6S0S4_ACTCC|nr:hypothetical protein CEY00_Acc00204 [Actinidia chinensis var. chinensis]
MVIAKAPSIALGPVHCHLCHAEGIGCSSSYAVTSSWIKSPFGSHSFSNHFGIRCRSPFVGAKKSHWLHMEREICISKVSVAADYSDSVPDSSSYLHNHGYHPLEELKIRESIADTKLTPAEIARTTVEANRSALLIFPSMVHCEPHEHISWAEFQYVVDEYGDIFFEVFDDENILQDRGASNPVNVLIGMDISTYEIRKAAAAEYNISDTVGSDDFSFNDGYSEDEDIEISDMLVEWGTPTATASGAHPIYFAKCLTKAVNMECAKMMNHPSNGVSVLGCLRPAFMDEELYLRRLFNSEDSDDYSSDWKDGEVWDLTTNGDENRTTSTIYRLEIMRMELFSVYGVQSVIGLEDFKEAEPDVLVHSTSAIIERFSEKGLCCNFALKAFCKKKGLFVEGANLIGVDSLGMDVRVFSGEEVQTHRFPFKVRATSEGAAEKQIHRLLFPPARRKKIQGSRQWT